MAYPPSKRHRGSQNEDPADAFEDDEDFTQDDLEEIDIIASQAITKDAQAFSSKRSFTSISVYPEQKAPIREGRKTFALGNSHLTSSSTYNNTQPDGNDTVGNGQDRDELYYSRLEAQQAELKKKLKEVEDQILMKNGEIQVLRDSLRLANQEKEQQRQAHLELERNRAHIQSEKEKELNKKMESLKSELHFKEAEMNEMRSKLQSSVKVIGTPVRNSVNSPGSRAFVTKESFSAELPVKTEGGKQEHAKNDKESMSFKTVQDKDSIHHKGPVLLNLLLQHPLEPSSLGLCHLLCISPDALPAIFTQSKYTSPTSSASSSTSSTVTQPLHQPRMYFDEHQSLAMSGLAMLTQCAPSQLFRRSCPPAVHLLPLLHYHINLYCQTLETIDRSGKSPLRASALSGASDSSAASTVEESLGAQEEFALAAIKALYHIVCESSEAVNSLLVGGEGKDPKKPSETCLPQPQSTAHISTAENACYEPLSHNPLLNKLFLLVDLKLQVVLANQSVTQNISSDSPYSTIQLCVRFLALLLDCDQIANKLCAHNYVCPFVRLFQYVMSRSDKVVSGDMWSRLELEVVRLLSKLFTQKTSTWAALSAESNCTCISETVRTVVVILHRQWLSIKSQEKHAGGVQRWTSPGVHLLRETLLLLHWLLLNDSSFSLHCLDVLHMYHQIIPAIRDTLRRIPDLSECEELAIEEICRPEAEEVEDMDIDTGS
ncbi:ATR-interacting protein [Bagarius yarrelli]|uniref:ATR-interacting protein n=1 Tax=Bagarius yarrelli TaxID=175774 RepID=A0A556U3S4_BAGYA|nr:ATR-interacting protein [Bagarius yarrelli]